MDVQSKLDELAALVQEARAVPMSASCMVNRGEVLALLDEVRALLPAELRRAEVVLADREAVVEEGRAEARRIVGEAEAERTRRLASTEVVAAADAEAARVRREVADEVETMRREVDDYVDAKLANFEVVLQKTLAAVHRGRAKLHGRTPAGDLAPDELVAEDRGLADPEAP